MSKRVHISNKDYLKGLKEVTANIQAATDRLEKKSVRGLADALMFVGTESQKRAPVETGDLRGSLEISIDETVLAKGIESDLPEEERKRMRKEGTPGSEVGLGLQKLSDAPEKGSVGKVTYGSVYAANQHEHTEYDHPMGGQAKYLESVLVENSSRILKLIAGTEE